MPNSRKFFFSFIIFVPLSIAFHPVFLGKFKKKLEMNASAIHKALMNQIQTFQDTFVLQTDARLKTNAFEMNYVKFKRCDNMVIVLYVPTPFVNATVMTNEDRKNVKDKRFAKFRASEAWPICILNTTTGEFLPSYLHVNLLHSPILYIVNQWGYVTKWL